MRTLITIAHKIDDFSEKLGTISMYLVIATFFVGFANVLLRYVGRFIGIRLTSNLLIELQWYLYSLIFFFGFAYILKHGINVRVDFWFANLNKKTQAWIDFIGHIISLIPFCLLGIWVTWNPILTSWGLRSDGTWGSWEMSPDPSGLPRAPIKSMVLLAFISLLLQGISEMIKLYAILRDQEELVADIRAELDAPIRIE